MKKIYLFFFIFLLVGFVALSFVRAGDYGLSETGQTSGFQKTDNVYVMVGNVIKIALSLVAIVFFGFILYAGIRWLTARGNPEFVEKARDTMQSAIIGLIIVAGSYAVTTFIFNRLGVQGPSDAPVQTGGGNQGGGTGDTCTNQTKDGFETDVDCGGKCNPCTDGKKCIKNIDCKSVNCQQGTCGAKLCSGSDFECGGDCQNRCGIGRKCISGDDCVSQKCVAGFCSP